jgi:hypothetical protein
VRGRKFKTLPLHIGIEAKSRDPMYIGLAPKPRHLSLGKVSVSLLSRRNRLFQGE